MRLTMLSALLWLLCAPAPGETFLVPENYSTIQAAVDAAADGDTVLVGPGTYVETVDYLEKSLTLKSTDGPEVTCIDGSGAGSVVTFWAVGDTEATLEGFTICNGNSLSGGGVSCISGSPPRTSRSATTS
jgi:hypothetical protein